MTDKIAEALNISPLREVGQELTEYKANTSLVTSDIDAYFEEASEDYRKVREDLLYMLQETREVFDAAKLAASTQDPKRFEAFARVLDSAAKAGKTLIDLHKDMYGIQPSVKEDVPDQQADTINNIIFTGTAADLMKLLKDKGAVLLPDQEIIDVTVIDEE